MQKESHRNLESLVEQDPVSRPLALLQLVVLESIADPVWSRVAARTVVSPPEGGTPALHGQEIHVDRRALSALLSRLADALPQSGVDLPPESILNIKRLDPFSLLEATVEWDEEALTVLANDHDLDPSLVATLGQCVSMPAMIALGRRILENQSEMQWEPGYCPVCGSWPLLAEQRGLEKQHWLRCGRCSVSWHTRQLRCVYCDNTDHTKLGYMAAEDERESRRVSTCRVCSGYLKVIATVSEFRIDDLLFRDLESLELDIAAIDEGFSRPDRPGFPIQIDLVEASESTGGWLPWR